MDVSLVLDAPEIYGFVKDPTVSVPALVTGTVEGDLDWARNGSDPPRLFVAVEINGTIAGTGQSFYYTNDRFGNLDEHRFSVLVDPTWFVQGKNEMKLWVATETDGTPSGAWHVADIGT